MINLLNDPSMLVDSSGGFPFARPESTSFGYLDVNGDGFATPFDALLVINNLDRGTGEGEATGAKRLPIEEFVRLVDPSQIGRTSTRSVATPTLSIVGSSWPTVWDPQSGDTGFHDGHMSARTAPAFALKRRLLSDDFTDLESALEAIVTDVHNALTTGKRGGTATSSSAGAAK